MTLGKVKHFLHGWVVGFVASLAMAVVGYILFRLAASFLLWKPVEFDIGSWFLWRGLALIAAFVATWFASSKEWWSEW
jgi:hypothetical protein